MTESVRKPNLLSINICDQVIREEGTHKSSLIGMFSNINAIKFPCTHPSLHVYIAVTGGRGRQTGELRFINDEMNETVVALKGDVEFPNPLAVVEMNFRIANLRLDRPGTYHFEFWLDSELVGHRYFTVKHVPQRER
ncbi:hypothetical protein KAW55_01805 [bacterium]|nr:hypothetical protein [bacterium]